MLPDPQSPSITLAFAPIHIQSPNVQYFIGTSPHGTQKSHHVLHTILTPVSACSIVMFWHLTLPFSPVFEKIDFSFVRFCFSSGTDGSGLALWLVNRVSLLLMQKLVLLTRTGGAGGLSSNSPLLDIIPDYKTLVKKKETMLT